MEKDKDKKLNEEKLSDVAGGKSQYFPGTKRELTSYSPEEILSYKSGHKPKHSHRPN